MRKLRVAISAIIILATVMVSSMIASFAAGREHPKVSPDTSPPVGQSFDYAVIIMLENHNVNETYYNGGATNGCLGNCTYFTSFANSNGLATGMVDNVTTPSAASYVAITSGYGGTPSACDTNGPGGTGCAFFTVANLVDSFDRTRLTWKSYIEGYPISSGCFTGYSGAPFNYSPLHNPFIFYSDIESNATRCARIVTANSNNVAQSVCSPTAVQNDDLFLKDLNSITNASNYMFLTPNTIDDAHDCTTNNVSAGNAWMNEMMPQILNSTLFKTKRAALFVTFDEPGCTFSGCPTTCPLGCPQIYGVWASNPSNPTTRFGYKSSRVYDFYSQLRTVENNWNLPTLTANDATAHQMTEFLLTAPSASFTYSPTNPQTGQQVTFTGSGAGGVPPYTFSWSFGDGGTATGSTATHTYTTGGLYNVTLTVKDSVQNSAVATQSIRVGQDFNISSTLSSLNVQFGSSNNTSINLNSFNNFAGTVNLSTSVSPTGLTPSLNPTSVTLTAGGSGSSTLTVTSSALGTYTVNVTGTNGAISHLTTITVNVLKPDFSISSSPPSQTVRTSVTANTTITVTSLNKFAGTVNLSTTASPPGASASLSITSVTLSIGGSATSTLTASSSIIGNYTITVTGTNGTMTHTALVTVTVVPPSVLVASDSAVGSTSLYTPGGQKLLQDSAGKMIAVYVDNTGRIGLSYANSDPTLNGWSTSVKSPFPASAYSWPAAVLVSLTSVRIIAVGGSASGVVTDIPVTVLRGSQNNITGFTFGSPTLVDTSGLDKYPAATLAHNGEILLAWAWQNTTSTQVKFLRWDPSLGWKNTAGTSSIPDVVLNSSGTSLVPNLIERPDNDNVYLLANRWPGPPSTLSFVKATWNGSTWTWGAQNLTYETNASDADDDEVGLAWDPTRSVVVAEYGITGTHTYGVFTLSATDVKTHMDTPTLAVTGDRGWAAIGVQNLTGDYYLFLISVNTDAGTGPLGFIRMPSGGAWNSTILWVNTNTDNRVTSLRMTGSGPSLDLLYIEGTSVPTQLRFVRVNPPSFSISPSPTTLTVPAGTQATSTIAVASLNGFTGTVNLSTTAPSGVSASLNPTSVTLTRGGTATSTLTINTTANGTYTVTIAGTIGALSHAATIMVTVTDFTITANPTGVTLVTNSTGNSAINVTALNGFSGTINLATNSTSCTITPSTQTGSGGASLSCSFASARITHIAITGMSGILSHTTIVTYTVQDLIITSTPNTVNVNVGSAGTSAITLTGLFGYSGPAGLSTNSTACSLTPSSLTIPGSATLSCTFTSVSTYHVTVTVTSGSLTHSTIVTINVQDFQINATPSTSTVLVGSPGTSTISITGLNGFAGIVSLATNSTACAVSPTSVTGAGSSTLSCTFSSSITTRVTVTGTNGLLTHSFTVTFAVTDFTLNASLTAVMVNAQTAGISGITVTAINGFVGTVSFSTNSTSCTVSPGTVTDVGSATLSCTFASAQNLHVKVTGASGSLSHTVSVAYTVQDFSITASPTSISLNAGTMGNSSITISPLNGFSSIISLSTNSTTACTISPKSVSGSGSATLSCTFTSASSDRVVVTVINSTLSHNITITFTIRDFSITSNPISFAINAATTGTSTIAITSLNGFTGTVNLFSNSTAACTLSPTSLNNQGNSNLSCKFLSATITHVTVTAISTTLSHSITVTYTIMDYALSSNPASEDISSPGTGSSTITVYGLNGFSGKVDLMTNVQPGGMSCSLSKNSITLSSTATNGTVSLSCTSSSSGVFNVTITGNCCGLSNKVFVIFNSGADFSLNANPTSLTVLSGSPRTSTISVSALNGFSGVVNLSTNSTSCNTSPSSVTKSGNSVLSCTFLSAGTLHVTVTGTSGSLSHTVTVTFNVTDFRITGTSPTGVNAGTMASSTITVAALNGFAGTVNLTDLVPTGLTCSAINPGSISGSGSATVSCGSTMYGNYTLTITGTSGSLVHTATILFQIQDFTISTTSIAPLDANQQTSLTITVTGLNRFSGTVSLADTIPTGLSCGSLTPNSVTGSGPSTISCTATVEGNYTLTIMGTSTPLVHSTNTTFEFQDYAITVSTPANVNVQTTISTTITIVPLNGFNGTVGLNDAPPAGLSCGTITPNSINGSGGATVSCSATVAGNYNLTITGSSSTLVHAIVATFRFQDFAFKASFATPVLVGVQGNSTITVTGLNGFGSNVTLTGTSPPGLTCGAMTPSTLSSSGSATIVCNASAAGNYTLGLVATSGSLTHTAAATLQVQDFVINATNASCCTPDGLVYAYGTVAALNGFNGSVALTGYGTVILPGYPSPAALNCAPVVPVSINGSGNMSFSCSGAASGNVTLTFTGRSGPLSRTAQSSTTRTGPVGGAALPVDRLSLLIELVPPNALVLLTLVSIATVSRLMSGRAKQIRIARGDASESRESLRADSLTDSDVRKCNG